MISYQLHLGVDRMTIGLLQRVEGNNQWVCRLFHSLLCQSFVPQSLVT